MIINTFAQSGNLGDLIYSLSVVKKMGGGQFLVKIDNVSNVIREYNNGPVPAEYVGQLSMKTYQLLAPLLAAQDYVTSVDTFDKTRHLVTVNLDEFRGVIHRTVTGNFLKAFYTTHKIPFTDADLILPWLTVPEPKRIAKFVVARSPRWRSTKDGVVGIWKNLIQSNNLSTDGVFVGLPEEHKDFEATMGVRIPYYPVADFLDLAQVIAGADGFMSNQTFTYGIAQGLGKDTILETFSARPLEINECYFPRAGCYYF